METTHKSNGYKVRGCRLCSSLICEACTVRDCYKNGNEKSFQKRYRNLCITCWSENRPHRKSFIRSQHSNPSLACTCIAREGNLCLRCKAYQNQSFHAELSQCFGEGCMTATTEQLGGRVCLWCDNQIPRNQADARREYDMKHLNARSFATYERIPDAPRYVQVWENSPLRRPPLRDIRDNTHVVDCPCRDHDTIRMTDI